jgi:gas vesicle protein GvpN
MKDSNNTAVAEVEPGQEGLWPEPSEDFVLTPYLQEVSERAHAYLQAGYPVHFSGAAGTGKTTLAFHVASQLGRPVSLMHGNDEFNGSDLVGSDSGYRKTKVVDNYIHSVVKSHEEMRTFWADNRLTVACRHGNTLVYDEFTRSRPEANNALLSVLEERILNMPHRRRSTEDVLEVHPDFRAIFTSNPEEYAGVHRTQDALLDRLITIKLSYPDRETEIAITHAKSGLSREDCSVVVDVVREFRAVCPPGRHRPSLRACVMMGRILARRKGLARRNDPVFLATCFDVLRVTTNRDGTDEAEAELHAIIARVAKPLEAPRSKSWSRGKGQPAPITVVPDPVASVEGMI